CALHHGPRTGRRPAPLPGRQADPCQAAHVGAASGEVGPAAQGRGLGGDVAARGNDDWIGCRRLANHPRTGANQASARSSPGTTTVGRGTGIRRSPAALCGRHQSGSKKLGNRGNAPSAGYARTAHSPSRTRGPARVRVVLLATALPGTKAAALDTPGQLW